ncbi:DNA-binding protein [Halobacteriales archaeon QS_3_64_16]|nr:MAG: DNA-binding protein [Halobacteriales archaeon QS_3_64_16]
MSGNGGEDDIEQLREERLQQLQDQQGGGGGQNSEAAREAQQAQREQAEAQKKAQLRKHLTDGARKRLNSVRMSKPDFADQVERQVLALARSGRLGNQIDEDQMRDLLQELKPDDGGYNIRRR